MLAVNNTTKGTNNVICIINDCCELLLFIAESISASKEKISVNVPVHDGIKYCRFVFSIVDQLLTIFRLSRFKERPSKHA